MEDQRDRDLAAILAGLRLLQRDYTLAEPSIYDIASNMDSFRPLNTAEIDDLCLWLNLEWDELHSDLETCVVNVKDSSR